AGRRQTDTAPAPLEKPYAREIFHLANTFTCRSQRKTRAGRAARETAGLGNMYEELQIDEVEAHPACSPARPCLRLIRRLTAEMPDCHSHPPAARSRHA